MLVSKRKMFSGVVSVHSMHSSFNLSGLFDEKKNDFLCKVLVSSVVLLPCVMLFIFFPCHCTRYMRNILI